MRTARGRTRRVVAALAAAAVAGAGLVGGAAVAAPPAPAAGASDTGLVTDPVDLVDPMVGTGQANGVVGEINNFPGPSMPFGMMQLSPDTQVSVGNGDRAYAGYRYSHQAIRGFSMNHASAGCWVFGDVPILPVAGSVGSAPWDRKEEFSHDQESAEVGRYAVTLKSSGIEAELSAATRSGGMTFDYPQTGDAQVIVNPGGSLGTVFGSTVEVTGSRTVTGSVSSGGFCGKGNRYTLYYAVEFDQDFSSFGTWEGTTLTTGDRSAKGSRAGAWTTFAPGSTVQAKVAMSYVSVEGAQANLAAEIPGWDFDAVRDDNRAAWSDLLGKVQVAGEDAADKTMFYTSLYHSMMHPNTFDDVDGRYVGFDQQIHQVADGRTRYANFSDWDTYRSLGALQAVLAPERASDMAQSLVSSAVEGGWLPRWPVANGYTGQMTGDSSVPLIASMYAFGARDFDAETALEYMVKGATTEGRTPSGYVQRHGIGTYLERGYAPQTEEFRGDHRVVGASITLEWSVADFAIGRLAGALGQDETAAEYQARGQYWQNIFDPSTSTVAARNADGSFVVPDGSGGFGQEGFDEGNAEQYTWLVPQNVAALTEGLGGREAVAERLDRFTTTHNSGPNEPRLWIGNEPNFGVPWLYDYVGQPWRTTELVDEITATLFSPTPDGKPGNDDLGAQAGWYVWAAAGLYPTTPGTDVLAINTPRFDRVVIDLGDGKALDLRAPGASTGQRYITGMTVDGQPWDRTYLPEGLIHEGGVVELALSAERDTSWGTSPEASPPSFREGEQGLVANAGSALVSVAPGGTATSPVDAQLFGDLEAQVAVSVDAPTGITVTGEALVPDGAGHLRGDLTFAVGQDVPEGFHDVEVTLTAGGTERRVPVTVRVAAEGSLFAAFDTVGSASQAQRGGANFDGAGNSFSREALAQAGLTPGSAHDVGGLPFVWPSSPEGRPDSLTLDGETVVLPAPSTGFSLVGAATNGTQQGQATVTFTDGTTATTTVGFGDWVLPSADGSPVLGNAVVARMDRRNGDKDSAFVFSTAPYVAPEGKKIVSITFPRNKDLHVFAVASDAVVEGPVFDVVVSARTQCVAGRVVVSVRAVSGEESPVDVKVSSAFGSRSFVGLASGKSASASFATRSGAVEAGQVTVAVTQDGRSQEVVASYDAATCD
ncbi:GH92 family glycosyl hydrolase [Oerskovia sp. NPDC060338]|uniref:GH92 family glycosyl hydrolase n=1 Tax=Oerskovia sp. NPDC060338 TaxID=3347100 RepID=UPI003652919C